MNSLFQYITQIICFTIGCGIYGQQSHFISERFQNMTSEDKVEWFIQTADSLFDIKKEVQAEILYEIAYNKAKYIKNDSLYDIVGNKYALFLYYDVENVSKSIKINQNMIDFCKENKMQTGLIDAYLLKGDILDFEKGKKIESFKMYSKAINLFSSTTPNELKAYGYEAKAQLLLNWGLNEEARKDFHRALCFTKKEKNLQDWVDMLISISTTFRKKELDSAYYYDRLILDYCDKYELDDETKVLAYNNMANTYLYMDQPEKAKKIIEKNINSNKIFVEKFYKDQAFLHTIGKVHQELEEYEKAIEMFEKAKEYAINQKDYTTTITTLEDLSESYEKIGDLESSLATTRLIKPVMDTLDLERIQKEVVKTESQRQLKEKEEAVVALKEEKQTITLRMSKAQFTSYALGGLLLLGIFVFINRASVNKVKFHKLNEKVNHNRLLSLQSAMNPHFLFNTFGTLQHFILKQEIKKANSYMTTLSGLIRNVFASSNSIYINFNDEVTILKSYIELELGRFDHNFEVVFEIPPKLSKDDPLIPSMILQPYAENAIIHGFAEKKGQKRLTIKFDFNDLDVVQCEITDNGIGRKKTNEIKTKSKIKKNLSIATRNTQERLKIINKKDDQEGNIVIKDLYDNQNNALGTKVTISLPIIKNQ